MFSSKKADDKTIKLVRIGIKIIQMPATRLKEIMFRLKHSTLVIVVFEMKGLQDDCCVFRRCIKERSDDKVIEILREGCEGGIGSF